MSTNSLYADRLVEITDHGIRFRLYYLPFGSKTVPFSDIEFVRAAKATFTTGKWRVWGTGDFVTWFPCDIRRPQRDTILFLKVRDKTKFIGFTVENAQRVIGLLKAKGVFDDSPFQAVYGGDKRIRQTAIRRVLLVILLAVIIPVVMISAIPFVLTTFSGHSDPYSPSQIARGGSDVLYHDSLVAIGPREIVFYWYDFPLGSSKHVPFEDIEYIRAVPPTTANGKWRFWGGSSQIWFPCDNGRASRDTIFHLKLKGRANWIGFTVEDSKTVREILQAQGLLQ
jgi:hypothetical protein